MIFSGLMSRCKMFFLWTFSNISITFKPIDNNKVDDNGWDLAKSNKLLCNSGKTKKNLKSIMNKIYFYSLVIPTYFNLGTPSIPFKL